jgi:hypothetical protein
MTLDSDAIRGLADDPDLTVAITTGTEYFGAGEITLRVRGDGEAVVLQRQAGEERSYEGRLEPERLRRLADELADDELTELADSGGDRRPDDLPVRIEVARGGEVLHQAAIRESDRWQDKRLDRVIRRYDALVEELTERTLPYGGGG